MGNQVFKEKVHGTALSNLPIDELYNESKVFLDEEVHFGKKPKKKI